MKYEYTYNMNRKIILIKKKRVERKNLPPPIDISSSILLNKLYLNIAFEGDKDAQKFIKKKLSSYQAQDKKKNKFDHTKFITYNQIVEKMVISKMRCYYCRLTMLFFYTHVREPLQWTLDRLDNTQGHNDENTVVACLKCNLERRTRNDQKFLFSKQMKIIKNNRFN